MTVAGFEVVRLRMPPCSLDGAGKKGAVHYLYIRRHTSTKTTTTADDDDRTLFLVNVPVQCTDRHLRALLNLLVHTRSTRAASGKRKRSSTAATATESVVQTTTTMTVRVESVVFHARRDASRHIDLESELNGMIELSQVEDEHFSKEIRRLREASTLPSGWPANHGPGVDLHTTGATAHVTLLESADTDRVWRAVNAGEDEISWTDVCTLVGQKVAMLTGRQRYLTYIRETRYPDPAALQSAVDAYMELHDAETALRKKRQRLIRTQPDEEGFVTIARGGRKGAGRQTDGAAKLAEQEKARKGVIDDLYRFQRQDERKRQQLDLRTKFEDDRRKIEELRKRRKFKPM